MKIKLLKFGLPNTAGIMILALSCFSAGVFAAPVPSGATNGDTALKQQIAELQAKTRQLEAALSAKGPGGSPSPGMPAMNTNAAPSPAASMPGMPAAVAGNSAAMGGMPMSPPAGPPMPGGGMGGMMTGMMGMMNQMMGMGAMPAASPGMAMSPPAIPQTALPGFPGVSHLYHIGSTGFFLEHAQHLNLSTDQQTALTRIKDQALAAKTATDRQIEQAERDMAALTSADQPDAVKIEAKVREIEKYRTDERLAFIRSVGEAANLLTGDQRKLLMGGATQSAAPSPSATLAPMSDM